ncbi:MAG: immunity 26/phosphotriesterase HocA family protein [Deltaproteobacteria bacterium]|nr:immunity 26/phosphotriesterase HocA family protein [Deltaproteobacteria bacterium]
MGSWGPKILEDDFAEEVTRSYLHRLYEGDEAQEAAARVIEEYGELDADERPVFWLALASVQHDYGRLVQVVKDEALRVIASGEDLARWNGDRRRARVLADLARKLEGPSQAAKKLRKAPPKLREGDLFRLPLEEGRYAFGRVLTETERAFYRYTSEQKRPPLDELVASEVLFVVGCTDDGFARRTWFVIGHRPLEARLRQPTYFFHQAVGADHCTVFDIWDRAHETKRPASECRALEQWAAWSAAHCRDRVVAALAGEPCKWIPRGR